MVWLSIEGGGDVVPTERVQAVGAEEAVGMHVDIVCQRDVGLLEGVDRLKAFLAIHHKR